MTDRAGRSWLFTGDERRLQRFPLNDGSAASGSVQFFLCAMFYQDKTSSKTTLMDTTKCHEW